MYQQNLKKTLNRSLIKELEMYKYIFLIIIVAASSLLSETSIFSSKGIGDIKPDSHLRTGVGKLDSLSISSSNYAMWTDVKNTTYSVSLSYDKHDVQGENQSSKFDGMTISGFNIAMPFGNKNVIGLSFSPFSRVDVLESATESELVDQNDPASTYKKQVRKEKDGGINSLSLVYGKRIGDLSLSTDFSAKFGTIRTDTENIYTRFVNDTTPIASRTHQVFDKSFYNHLTLGLGLSYKVADNLNIGGYLSVPFYSFTEKEVKSRLFSPISGSLIEEKNQETEEIDSEWPIEFSIGMSYDFNESLNISSDFNFIGFKDKKLGIALEGVDSSEEYNDYTKFSISSTYTPSRKKLDTYYKKVSYTLGGILEKREVTVDGNDIYDKTLMCGLTLPYDRDRASIKANLYYTMAGNKNDSMYEENIIKFELIFTGSSSWWLKKNKYDD